MGGGLYAYSNRPGEGTCVSKGLVFHSPDRVGYTGYMECLGYGGGHVWIYVCMYMM